MLEKILASAFTNDISLLICMNKIKRVVFHSLCLIFSNKLFFILWMICRSEYIRAQSVLSAHGNEWVQFNYMSVTVKVQYGEKLFKLSQGVASLQQVQEEMARRYPNQLPHLQYYFEGALVADLAALIVMLGKQGKTSIKLVARPSAERPKEEQQSIIEIVSNERQSAVKVRKVNESVVLLEERMMEVEPKRPQLPPIEYRMPKEFYVCYNCTGTGVYQSSQIQHMCEICNGRGELNNDHKYIHHIMKLFQKHGSNSQKEEIKKEEEVKPEFPRIFRGLSKIYEMNIAEVNKLERMEVGKEFIYQFQIHNIGKDLPEDLQIVNCETKEAIKVKTLKAGEKLVVEVGPFKCQNEGLLEQAFYLCYRVENGWERLGYRFGFRVRGFKNVEVKKMESNSRDTIRNLKLLSGSKKSEDYIAMKLKAIDIDLNNCEVDDETLIEIVRHIR